MKLLLLVMVVVLVGCGKSKQLTELELKLDDAVERINVLEEALLPVVDPATGLPPIGGGGLYGVDPATGLPIGYGGRPARPQFDDTTGLPISGTPPVQPKK